MSEQARRHFSVPEKVAILKRHLLEGIPVSKLCDEVGVKPTVFYSWQRLLFENAHLAFENGRKSKVAEDAKGRRSSNSKPRSSARTKCWPSSWRSTPS